MATATLTLKLPFLNLNAVKAEEFERLQALNTEVANGILGLPHEVRSKLTTKDFGHVEIGSGWMNQTIRNVNAKKKAKHFRVMLLETNNQGWTLHRGHLLGWVWAVARREEAGSPGRPSEQTR